MPKNIRPPKEAPDSQLVADPAATPAERPAYTGNLAADELKREGGKLVAMLVARADQLGMSLADMSKQELGCTYGYIFQLRSGARKTQHISDEFATRCAIFLGIPRIAVLMAAGRVAVEDYFDRPLMAASQIETALRFVLEDTTFGVHLQPEVLNLSKTTQYGIVRLYEKATGTSILSGAITPENLAQKLTELDAVIAKLREEATKNSA